MLNVHPEAYNFKCEQVCLINVVFILLIFMGPTVQQIRCFYLGIFKHF